MRLLRPVLSLTAVTFAAANGYHLLNCAARLVGLYALKDATRYDPATLDALIAEYSTHTAS